MTCIPFVAVIVLRQSDEEILRRVVRKDSGEADVFYIHSFGKLKSSDRRGLVGSSP